MVFGTSIAENRSRNRTRNIVVPDANGPLVYLPDGRRPSVGVSLICPGWRDFTFGFWTR